MLHHTPSGSALWASFFRMFVLTSPDMTYEEFQFKITFVAPLCITNRNDFHADKEIRKYF